MLKEKIMMLRKKHLLSQEELAFKLDVTRQSVSKWENGSSQPDIQKIIKLSECFHVSTDYLLKDHEIPTNEDSETYISEDELNKYLHAKTQYGLLNGIGLFVCMVSFLPLLLLLAFAEKNYFTMNTSIASTFGLIILLVIVSIGTFLLTKGNGYSPIINTYEKTEIRFYDGHHTLETRQRNSRKKYLTAMIGSCALTLSGLIGLLWFAMIDYSLIAIYYALTYLILTIGLSLALIIYHYYKTDGLDYIIHNKVYAFRKKIIARKIERVAICYWPFITSIYLGWSLWSMHWHKTWILWPVSALIFISIIGLIPKYSEVEIEKPE